MLRSVAGDCFKGAIVSAKWDVESYDGLASLDQVKILLINSSFAGSLVEEKLDLLEETGFTVIIEFGSELRLGGLSSELSEDGALSKS